MTKKQEYFNVLRTCRKDFEGIGHDMSKYDDEQMTHIARKLGDMLMQYYWETLTDYSDISDIPKN